MATWVPLKYWGRRTLGGVHLPPGARIVASGRRPDALHLSLSSRHVPR